MCFFPPIKSDLRKHRSSLWMDLQILEYLCSKAQEDSMCGQTSEKYVRSLESGGDVEVGNVKITCACCYIL